jgi:hypothetical protein
MALTLRYNVTSIPFELADNTVAVYKRIGRISRITRSSSDRLMLTSRASCIDSSELESFQLISRWTRKLLRILKSSHIPLVNSISILKY